MPSSANKDFLGFPIPSAAGLVASLTLLIIHFNEKEKSLGHWNYLIALVLVFLSAMMVSTVRYPSFKSLGLRSTSTFIKAIGAALFVGGILILREKILYYMLPMFFTAYLIYGFVRPSLSRAWRREIEEEDDEPDGGELIMSDWLPFFMRRSPVLDSRCCFHPFPSGRSISPSSTKARDAVSGGRSSSASARRRWKSFTARSRSRDFPLFLEFAWSKPRWKFSRSFFFCFSGQSF